MPVAGPLEELAATCLPVVGPLEELAALSLVNFGFFAMVELAGLGSAIFLTPRSWPIGGARM